MKRSLLRALGIIMMIAILSACTTSQRQDMGMVAGGVVGGVAGSALTKGSTAGTIAGAVGGAYVGRELSQ